MREGEGQVVTIIGEGGIGKSRLLQRFREEIAATPYTWLECATAPFFQNTPFYAVADMLQQSFQWEAGRTMEQRLAALGASLGLAGLDPNEASIAGIMGIAKPAPDTTKFTFALAQEWISCFVVMAAQVDGHM